MPLGFRWKKVSLLVLELEKGESFSVRAELLMKS